MVLQHLSHLGLRVNWEKSKLSPVQSISFLGMELDLVNLTARLKDERTQSVLNYLNLFRGKMVVLQKQFERLLGHMVIAATVTPLGLFQESSIMQPMHSHDSLLFQENGDFMPRWSN